jgi:hypothetical protein
MLTNNSIIFTAIFLDKNCNQNSFIFFSRDGSRTSAVGILVLAEVEILNFANPTLQKKFYIPFTKLVGQLSYRG